MEKEDIKEDAGAEGQGGGAEDAGEEARHDEGDVLV